MHEPLLSNDDLSTVWDVLAASPTPLRPRDLVEEATVTMPVVLAALARLRDADLLEHDARGGHLARRVLDARAWGRALHIGIPLEVLDRHARLRPRQGVWNAAETEAWDAGRLAARQQHRQKWLSGRAATRVAASDLAHVMDDVRTAIAAAAARPPVAAILNAILKEGNAILDTLRRQAEREP